MGTYQYADKLNILYLTTFPEIHGPIPKINRILIPSLQSLGCEIITLPWGRHLEKESLAQKIFGRVDDIRPIVKALEQKSTDILFIPSTHDEYALMRDLLLLVACQKFPIPKVILFHGGRVDDLARPKRNLLKILTRYLLKLCTAVMVLSSEEQNKWHSLFPEKPIFRVDNPFIRTSDIEFQKYKKSTPRGDEKIELLFVGRLIKSKGIFDLLSSMPIILNKVRCHLTIAGEGPEDDEITRCINKLGLNEFVSKNGYLQGKEIHSLFYNADILILPTTWQEGFPTVITEAMDVGIPVITTKIRGAADHLQEGINALFVPPNDPQSLAKAIIMLAHDPQLRIEMGLANREKVKCFSPELVGRQYVEVFRSVMDSQKIKKIGVAT